MAEKEDIRKSTKQNLRIKVVRILMDQYERMLVARESREYDDAREYGNRVDGIEIVLTQVFGFTSEYMTILYRRIERKHAKNK